MTKTACPACGVENPKSLSKCPGCGRALRFELSPRIQQGIIAAIVLAFVAYMVWDTRKSGERVQEYRDHATSAPH
jgi:uncharacterized paraquat-inducible protein A